MEIRSLRLRVRWLSLLAALLLGGITFGLKADNPASKRRAKAPSFDPQQVSATFFPDVFSVLQGERPKLGEASGGASKTPGVPTSGEGASPAGSVVWDDLISPTSLEDEVKSLKVALNQSVTTPTQFRSRGYRSARREFTLLNMLFWIIEHYRGDVRWKNDATAVRQKFGSVAGNSKAGGNEQTYAQAKQAKELLDRLIRGERAGVEPNKDEEVSWEPVSPRRPLMQWLEKRFEANLKAWTSNDKEFQSNSEELLREAELVAAIAQFFMEEGMDDADDEEYRAFCESMKAGALAVASATKNGDLTGAQRGVGEISKACSNCHESYR